MCISLLDPSFFFTIFAPSLCFLCFHICPSIFFTLTFNLPLFLHKNKPALSPACYLLFSYLCFLSLSHSHSTILTFTLLLIFLYSSYIFLLIFRELEQARTMQLIVLCTMAWTMKASSKFYVVYYFKFIST